MKEFTVISRNNLTNEELCAIVIYLELRKIRIPRDGEMESWESHKLQLAVRIRLSQPIKKDKEA